MGGGEILVDGRAIEPGRQPLGLYAGVSEHFFSTLGVKLVSGRTFTVGRGARQHPGGGHQPDNGEAPVARRRPDWATVQVS